MKYISTKEYAKAQGLAERTVRNYCVQGKITGAQLIGKSWSIPADAPLPDRKNASLHFSPLLKVLKEQRDVQTSLQRPQNSTKSITSGNWK